MSYRLKAFVNKPMQQSTFSRPTVAHYNNSALGFTGNLSHV